MNDLTRRKMVTSGLALTAATMLPRTALAKPLDQAARLNTGTLPREELLFDFGWRFSFGHGTDPAKDFGFGAGQGDFAKTGDFKISKHAFDDSGWRAVDLPHDWAVELPFVNDEGGEGESKVRSHGYKPLGRRYPETSIGWYRRAFEIPESDRGRRIWIEFDGALRDAVVFVNGSFIGRNDNGYAPFRFDVTDFLAYGAKNVVVVRLDASFGDGWFYEGAGLYRHVWLTKHDPLHIGKWDSVVRAAPADGGAKLDLATVVENEGDQPAEAAIEWTILDADGHTVATATAPARQIAPGASADFSAAATIAAAQLWAPGQPYLYSAVVKVLSGAALRDAERVSFGVRSARFDADKGFFLNGKSVKIQGTCNHHDHAGVGAALPDQLHAFRLSVLQEMGCNAVRTSHNMPTPEWVEACDRAGVMMMCETRQMSSNPEGLMELELMVKRHRNSPSIIIWSIGNEEWLLQSGEMAKQGAAIAATMVKRCHALDPTRVVSAAVNGSNEQGVSDPLDIIGFNYNSKFPDDFHKKHPTRPVYGSETSSAISTRGEYSSDKARNTISSYDGVVPWGETPEQWWSIYGSREWLAGGFAWTGFDYRGEPTPYGWPSINSQFGIVDMCGFPKDYFYYYKAWWRTQPSLHLFPHWNWAGREGEEIAIWVYSNLDEVELLVNGKSLGVQRVPHLGHLAWKAAYQPGVIEARGRRGGRVVLTERHETTGPAHSLRMTADRTSIDADGEDVAMVRVEALDAKGRPVPTANHKLRFKVSGAGKLIGVGNGDPNCLESDKGSERSLFNGLAQLIIQTGKRSGPVVIEAVEASPFAAPLAPARLLLRAQSAKLRPAVPLV
ncbi:MAG: beta-galactosidase GalA [Sphingomonas bacterium]